ncbi:Retrovirus-related Pol polyprotein from transposon opus [Araneus ventricosus]|uniref:Retrovirus-related Pol polyprotein from transposon opus n=1 Tax=Araneus ventricosus TaxID=182803 RepID=A0A4Y2RNE8_ARAVE|nr:Retrovirus-related Pol polyprotein from transposon opus [Araneus ventricosus]
MQNNDRQGSQQNQNVDSPAREQTLNKYRPTDIVGSNSNQTYTGHFVPCVFSHSSLPIIDVLINNLNMKALLDTGATMNILSQSAFNKLTDFHIVNGSPVELKTITGLTMYSNMIICVNMNINGTCFKTQFVMAGTDLTPTFYFILSQNFFICFDFILDSKNSVLKNDVVSAIWNFSRMFPNGNSTNPPSDNHSKQKQNSNQSLDNDKCDAELSNINSITGRMVAKTQIPAFSQKYVEIKLDDNCNVFSVDQPILVESLNDRHSHSFLIVRSVSNLNNISELGQCDLIKHEIHLSDQIPIRQKPYRDPYHLKSEMRSQINVLLEAGIIQPSTSSFSAPVILVKKSDGSYRLVADLRKLNAKTVPDNYPLPNVTEMIDNLSGAKFFSTLDLTSGFHQMVMHPDHKKYTAIATEFGLFEYKRLPFGLRNASASYQRLINLVFAGLNEFQVSCYIDDLVIAAGNFDGHLATTVGIRVIPKWTVTIHIAKDNERFGKLRYKIIKTNLIDRCIWW